MEHTKGILLECNLSEGELDTIIEALSRDYVENDVENIFEELEGTIDKYYEKVEKAQSKQPDMEW